LLIKSVLYSFKIEKDNPTKFISFAGAAAFITYCSMYAFRKPFAAATFEGLTIAGFDYKIVLIISQAIGYTLSKFLGIKFISELEPRKRIKVLLVLIGVSWLALFLFALIPFPFNFWLLFFNGLPLGFIWGIVFSFLEGRRFTEVLGAIMASSFIFASGIVKALGRFLIDSFGITEFWMPFFTGLLFLPILFLGIYMLQKIPAQDKEDKILRTERRPMNKGERRNFFLYFAPGIIFSIVIYVALTVFRDIRDNFAVELWNSLGFKNTPKLLVLSEIPVAIAVLVIISLMMLIKSNKIAFFLNQFIFLASGTLLLLVSFLFLENKINALVWIVIIGFSMYLPYISFHVMLYERWIALFKYKSNIGYLMYVSDAFGYLGSTCILFLKGSKNIQLSWSNFFIYTGIFVGVLIIIFSLFSILYFNRKVKENKYIN
jgi:MFS family permease